jgi:DNA-binding transcriptional regulator YiaG
MCEIKDLRSDTGMSQKEFAYYFDIPVDSIQNWETQRRKPPKYVPNLIKRILEYRKRFGELQNGGE